MQTPTKPETITHMVIVNVSKYIPGDERSISNPGHGYPAHTQYCKEAIQFTSESKLKEWIEKNEATFNKKEFTAFKVEQLKVTVDIRLESNKAPVYRSSVLADNFVHYDR